MSDPFFIGIIVDAQDIPSNVPEGIRAEIIYHLESCCSDTLMLLGCGDDFEFFAAEEDLVWAYGWVKRAYELGFKTGRELK